MFKCHVCSSTEAQAKLVSEVFMINGKPVLVEQIPATVCARCGEATFSRATTEKVRQMLQGETQPVRSVPMDVFAFA